MGRRKNEVWGSFNEVRVDGVLRAKCKKCEETVVNNPERLKSHLTKCTADGQPQAKKMVQSVLSTVVNPTKQHEVDMQVLRYLIASNTPFLQAENKEFVKMLNMLRPGTKVPCRQTLAGPLLDQLFELEKNKIIDFVKNSYCSIAIDGWSTRSNEHVIGVSLHSGGKSYLVNTINTSGEPRTIEYLSELLKRIGMSK